MDKMAETAALTISTQAEHDEQIENQIKTDNKNRKKIDMAAEMSVLKSKDLDQQMEAEEEDTHEMSVTDAYRNGQTTQELVKEVKPTKVAVIAQIKFAN